MKLKQCSNKKCKHPGPQPINDFSFDKRKKDGLKTWCRSCISQNQADRYQRIKENEPLRHKAIVEQSLAYYHRVKPDLIRKYGIDAEQYEQMIISQGNCCKICKIDFNKLGKRRPSVDHNHATGKVRDLLCNHCNTILGLCKEDTSVLESAVKYLKLHST